MKKAIDRRYLSLMQ